MNRMYICKSYSFQSRNRQNTSELASNPKNKDRTHIYIIGRTSYTQQRLSQLGEWMKRCQQAYPSNIQLNRVVVHNFFSLSLCFLFPAAGSGHQLKLQTLTVLRHKNCHLPFILIFVNIRLFYAIIGMLNFIL